jgi:hypothetical protein
MMRLTNYYSQATAQHFLKIVQDEGLCGDVVVVDLVYKALKTLGE